MTRAGKPGKTGTATEDGTTPPKKLTDEQMIRFCERWGETGPKVLKYIRVRWRCVFTLHEAADNT